MEANRDFEVAAGLIVRGRDLAVGVRLSLVGKQYPQITQSHLYIASCQGFIEILPMTHAELLLHHHIYA